MTLKCFYYALKKLLLILFVNKVKLKYHFIVSVTLHGIVVMFFMKEV